MPRYAWAAIRVPKNARPAAKAGETFGALLPRYLAHKRAQLKPRSFEEVDRHLTVHARSLHGRSIDAVDRRAAALLFGEDRRGQRAGGGQWGAGQLLGLLRGG